MKSNVLLAGLFVLISTPAHSGISGHTSSILWAPPTTSLEDAAYTKASSVQPLSTYDLITALIGDYQSVDKRVVLRAMREIEDIDGENFYVVYTLLVTATNYLEESWDQSIVELTGPLLALWQKWVARPDSRYFVSHFFLRDFYGLVESHREKFLESMEGVMDEESYRALVGGVADYWREYVELVVDEKLSNLAHSGTNPLGGLSEYSHPQFGSLLWSIRESGIVCDGGEVGGEESQEWVFSDEYARLEWLCRACGVLFTEQTLGLEDSGEFMSQWPSDPWDAEAARELSDLFYAACREEEDADGAMCLSPAAQCSVCNAELLGWAIEYLTDTSGPWDRVIVGEIAHSLESMGECPCVYQWCYDRWNMLLPGIMENRARFLESMKETMERDSYVRLLYWIDEALRVYILGNG